MSRTPTTPSHDVNRLGRRAAGAAAALLGLVVLFQCGVVLGAPWGEFTQGGGTIGQLSTAGRLVAAASALLLLIMAIAWLATVYLGLAVLLNLISPSAKERALWAPTSTAIFVLVLVAMLATRPQRHTM